MKSQKKLLLITWGLVSGVLLIIGGFLSCFLFSTLVNYIIESKVALLPGTEVSQAWMSPPLTPLLKIYYFNATNAEEYLTGGKLRVEEVGPFVYEEKWVREDVQWSEDDSEVSFRMRRTYHHRPDLSKGALTDEVILPNVPMFGMLGKFRTDPDLFASSNSFLNSIDPPQSVFEKKTVGEVTWGYEHSLVTMANSFLPEDQKLPELFGYFYGKNNTEDKEFQINTGKHDILDLGSIVKYDNKTHLSAWYDDKEAAGDGKTCNRIHGTDGSLFPPHVTENQIFYIFNKDICRSLPIEYKETVQHFGMDTLRFVPHRTAFTSQDSSCFCPPGNVGCAPEGMFNVSACQGGAPMMLSWPHFYNGDTRLLQVVEGLKPDPDKHEFQIDILPQIGVGLRAAIRMQINIFLETQGVTKLENATDAYVPIVWFEDGIEELDDPETINLLRSAVLQPALIHAILYPTLFAVGFLVLLVSLGCLSKWRKDRNHDNQVLSSNIAMISPPEKL